MSDEDERRPIWLSRSERNDLNDLVPAATYLVDRWDRAPESAWDEIADEKRTHRSHCSDGDCFAENVMLRLGGITSTGTSPFDFA